MGMTSMDQKQLERFVDVVESGSLSRTSRRLNTSQPALSKSLQEVLLPLILAKSN